MNNSKPWLELGLYTAFLQRTINLWRSDKTKEDRFRLLGMTNYGKVNTEDKLKDNKSHLVICYVNFS